MELVEQAFHNSLETYEWIPQKEWLDLDLFFKSTFRKIKKTLISVLKNLDSVKVQMILKVKLKKYVYEGESATTTFVEPIFNSTSTLLVNKHGIKELLDDGANEIINSFHVFLCDGSGWIISNVVQLLLRIYEYEGFHGAGITSDHKPLPYHIKSKNACLTIVCDDKRCFIYCILAHIFPDQNAHRMSRYAEDKPCWKSVIIDNLHQPMNIKHIPNFEKDNRYLSINVLGYNKSFYPLYVTVNKPKNVKFKITLLLYQKHYYLVKHLSRLLFGDLPYKRKKWHICHYCLCRFVTASKLRDHSEYCQTHLQKKVSPPKGSKIQFKNFSNMVKMPFVLYWDSEAMLEKNTDVKTMRAQTHIPISICVFRKCIDDTYTKPPTVFTGLDCVQNFLDFIEREVLEISTIINTHIDSIRWSQDDEIHFHKIDYCDMCKIKFSREVKKCRDHYHMFKKNAKSNARFVLCNRCNLTYARSCTKVSIIAHGSENYDLHHIVRNLKNTDNINVLAKNTEKFLSLKLRNLNVEFIDSLNFLPSSLRKLASILLTHKSDYVKANYLTYITEDHDNLELLLGKGSFPYSYLSSTVKLKEKRLPPKSCFYDILTDSNISDFEYKRCQKIWDKFKCQDLQSYMEIYLILDTILLAAIFEHFRDITIHNFKLDPCHYVSSASLTFDAMLKMTRIQIDTLPDVEMYSFCQSAIRGGIAQTSHRYALANNRFCPKYYDADKPESSIVSVDINALYSTSMQKSLPYKDFKWVSPKELEQIDVTLLGEHDSTGYFFEVCLEYPEKLHSSHNQLPLAPEKRSINPKEWSPYTQNLADILNMKKTSSPPKLVLTLHNKHKYRLHYMTLRFYMQMGLKLIKIHKAISFKQKRWLKPYIDLNIKNRESAENDFDSTIYKFYNNAIYGRLLLNLFTKKNYKLLDNVDKFKKMVAKPTFKSAQIIRSDLVGIQYAKDTIVCNSAIACGVAVLDLSKINFFQVYHCLYNTLYHKKNLVLYSDTDSIFVSIPVGDPYQHMIENPRYFDFSNFPKDSPYYDDSRRRKPGLLKDNYGGNIIEEICCLKPKMYSVRLNNAITDCKAKGVARSLIRDMTIDDYVHCLFYQQITKNTFHSIRSFKHQVYTIKQSKISLSPFCDKRYWLSDGISSLAFGHYLLKDNKSGHKRKCSFDESETTLKQQKCCCGRL